MLSQTRTAAQPLSLSQKIASMKYRWNKLHVFVLLFVLSLTVSMIGQEYILLWRRYQEKEFLYYNSYWQRDGEKQIILPRRIGPSCSRMISGDITELKKVEAAMSYTTTSGLTDNNHTELRMNGCSASVDYDNYINISMSKDEQDFPIAFSIIVYRDLPQIERLLKAIWRPNNAYCVFVDSKSRPEFTKGVHAITECFDNVVLHEDMVDIRWGTFSVLKPELLCMDLLWKMKTKWKYFINLTGQEYPLKTNYEMVQILKAYRGGNDIGGILKRAKLKRWEVAGSPPFGLQAIKGPVHIVACRGYVDYVLHSEVALALRKWVQHTRVPDETFFSTLNFNPQLRVPGSYTGKVDDRKFRFMGRYKLWSKMSQCSGQVVRGICIMEVWNLLALVRAPDLFVNKFIYKHHPLAYDCLEEWYRDKVRKEMLGELYFNTTRYRNRWMVTHHF